MKVVILAGGFGTRFSEETQLKPKPMIEIGNRPILWHIMKIYASHGFTEFIICLGYKSSLIKQYFLDYHLQEADISVHTGTGAYQMVSSHSENWSVTLAETGLDAMTGGRIKQIQKYVGDEPFMLTYGDGVANVDLTELINFHQSHGKIATITAVQPLGRFGTLRLSGNGKVEAFMEKISGDGGWVNGGFFVLQPDIFDYIDSNLTIFERTPLEQLAKDGELIAYKHSGFWHSMDTQHDKKTLDQYWAAGNAPWKIWEEGT